MKSKKNSLSLIIIMCILLSSIVYFVLGDIFNTKIIIPPAKNQIHTYTQPIKISKIVIPPKQEKYAIPIHLKIPKINIDVNIENVGITSKGVMDIPKNFSNAGWFNLGPRPGEKGVAVIDGHFGYRKGIPSIFNNLHKLNIGDKLYIEDEKGIINTFIVSKVKIYKQSDDTYDLFNSNDENSYLNIITCQGIWNENKKSYPYRLVVFTEKEIK